MLGNCIIKKHFYEIPKLIINHLGTLPNQLHSKMYTAEKLCYHEQRPIDLPYLGLTGPGRCQANNPSMLGLKNGGVDQDKCTSFKLQFKYQCTYTFFTCKCVLCNVR